MRQTHAKVPQYLKLNVIQVLLHTTEEESTKEDGDVVIAVGGTEPREGEEEGGGGFKAAVRLWFEQCGSGMIVLRQRLTTISGL